jgi:hypothetical protein
MDLSWSDDENRAVLGWAPSDFRDGCCYCDECRGDGLFVSGLAHDPTKPPDDSDAACDRRFDGLVAHLEAMRPYFAAKARAEAWGVDPSEPVAA